MLLPFNQVDSRSAQLLLAHPLEKRAKKAEEIIVASEALHAGNGLEHYVVVTTARVVLFRLKVVDGQGFVTVNVVWQVRFEKGARITSSLGNRGHNGSVLYVSRYYSKNKEAESAFLSTRNLNDGDIHPDNKEERSNFFPTDGEGKFPNPDTPKSFYPLGPTSAAFRLRSAWPFAPNEDDEVVRFPLEGDFKQRLQMAKIHNAICCVCGDLESVIYEGSQNGSEGTTSFGPLIFEHEHQDGEPVTAKADRRLLYPCLDRVKWLCNKTDAVLSLESIHSSSQNDPAWLTESRARAMHVSSPSPLFSDADLGSGEVLSSGLEPKLVVEGNQLEFDQEASLINSAEGSASTEARAQQTIEDESFSKEYQSGISVEESIGTFPLEEEPKGTGNVPLLSPIAVETSAANQTWDQATPGKLPMIDESSMPTSISYTRPPAPFSPPHSAERVPNEPNPGSVLDERLRRVEAMLECLVGGESSIANVSHGTRPHAMQRSHTTSQYDGDHLSMASSVNPPISTPPGHQPDAGRVEVEALMNEIAELKRQLAAKTDSAPEGAGPTKDESSGPKKEKKKKLGSRIKNALVIRP